MIERNINGIDIGIDINNATDIFLTDEGLNFLGLNDEELNLKTLLFKLSKNAYVPLHLHWELTSKCNFSCPFCYIVNRVPESHISFLQAKPLLDFLINNGLLFVTLTGGEIFTHPDFIDIYIYLKKRGVLVELYTNNYLLTNDILNTLIEYKPFMVEVSIYGVDNNSFQETTNSRLNFEKVLENILVMKNNDINIICKTPINKLSVKSINKIERWCKLNKIEYYYSTNTIDGYNGDDLSIYDIDELTKLYFDSQRAFELHPKTKEKTINCSGLRYVLNLDYEMNLLLCRELKFNQIKYKIDNNSDFQFIINSFKEFIKRHINKKIKNCVGCKAIVICKACLANISINSEDYCVDELYCKALLEYYNKIQYYNSMIDF